MDYASLDADESHADDTPQPLRIKKLVQQVSPGITSSNMNLTPESMSAPRQRSPDIMSGNMNRIVEFPSTIGQRTSDLTCSSMDMIIEYLPTPRQRSLDITSSDIAVATESMSYPQQLIYSENIPERKASLQRSHVDFTSSPYAPSPWSPQPSNQTSYLNVQKHRRAIPQTNCGDSGSLSGGLLSDPNLNTIQTSTIQEVSQAKENPVGLGITFPSNRASSAGLILPSELLSPFGEGPLIPASPTPVITRDQARAMSASEEYIEATVYEALGQSPEQNMMRHPSYKRRFFAKMSGLASRYKGKQVATGLNRSPRTSLEITSTNPEHKDDTCSKSTREGVIQDTCETSYSKMGSDDITRSFTSPPKLETASLKALPSPEKRSIGLKSQDSPTAAEGISVKEGAGQGSCNISSSEIKANNVVDLLPSPLNSNVPSRQSGLERPPSGICAYTDAIITNHYSVPNLKVSARAEIDNLDSENEQSIFVAIEIKGLLSRPEKEVVEKQLDVAIIIDNSFFTSPATLTASLGITQTIGLLLNQEKDKMAIIANSPSRKNGRHNDIVLGLRTVNKSQVRSAVKKIDLSTEHPEMFTSIELAKNLLTRSSGADEQTGGNLANIFILTPNLSRVPAESLRDKKVQIHIVNPGIIPWKGQENIDCNGWYLSSLERSNLDYLNQATDLGHESLLNTLRVAIRQCRTGSMAGVMRNLNLQIKPGMNCSIEGIMGRENLWSLRPGELITVLVKVRVGCFSSRSTSGTGTSIEESWGTSPNSNHLLNELNVILGASPITILTAKLSYTHSLFNYGTECVFRADCNVKNQMPWSGRAKDPSSVENATISQSKITIQKRLVFYLATQLSPSHAISTLNDHFGVGGVRSVCPIYIKLVMEELKYQAYVIEQLDYLGIPKELLEHENDPNQTLYEHFGEGYFEIPEFEPVGWTAHMTGKITDSGPGFGSPDLVSDSPTRIIPERKKILKSIKERIYISDAVERDDGSGGPISMEDPSSFRIHALLQQTVNDATLKSRPHVRIQDSLDGINLHLKQNGHSSRENRNPAQVHCLGGKYDVTTQEATSEHGRIMGDRGFDLLPSTVEASKENLNPNRKLKVTFQEQPRPKLEVPMRDRREEARKLWEKVSQRSHAETQRDLNQGLRAGKKVFIAKNVNDAARFLAENDMAAQINREADTMHREREAREKGEKNRWGKDRKK